MKHLWLVVEKLAERGCMVRVAMWPKRPYVISVYDDETMSKQTFYESDTGDLAEIERQIMVDWGHLLKESRPTPSEMLAFPVPPPFPKPPGV